jgi:butyryl-CoA dehydrogenase
VRIIEHADVKRMLLAQKAYCEGALALNLYCARWWTSSTPARPKPPEARLLLEVLTPIAKSWPSEWCLEANSWPSRSTAATATRATSRWSSTGATTA